MKLQIPFFQRSRDSNNSIQSNKSIIIPSRIHLTYYNLHNLQNIVKWKDQRLGLVEIPKGLIEILQNTGFREILNNQPSHIAEKLGIDSYIGEIIYKETKKTFSKINPDFAVDSNDNNYVLDTDVNCRVQKFDHNGVFIKAWGFLVPTMVNLTNQMGLHSIG